MVAIEDQTAGSFRPKPDTAALAGWADRGVPGWL